MLDTIGCVLHAMSAIYSTCSTGDIPIRQHYFRGIMMQKEKHNPHTPYEAYN